MLLFFDIVQENEKFQRESFGIVQEVNGVTRIEFKVLQEVEVNINMLKFTVIQEVKQITNSELVERG